MSLQITFKDKCFCLAENELNIYKSDIDDEWKSDEPETRVGKCGHPAHKDCLIALFKNNVKAPCPSCRRIDCFDDSIKQRFNRGLDSKPSYAETASDFLKFSTVFATGGLCYFEWRTLTECLNLSFDCELGSIATESLRVALYSNIYIWGGIGLFVGACVGADRIYKFWDRTVVPTIIREAFKERA